MRKMLGNISLKVKLAVILLLVSTIPAAMVGGVFLYEQDNLQRDYERQLTNSVINLGDTIDRNLFERYGDVQAFGYNTAAHDPANWGRPGADNPLVQAMNDYTKAYGLYPLMMLVDMEGNVLAVNTVDARGKAIETAALYEKNFGDAEWFQNAVRGKFLEGKDGLTGTFVGAPEQNSIVADIYGSSGYVIPFSAPVRDGSGQAIGVWVNFAGMDLVDGIVGEFRNSVIAAGVKDAAVMVIDKKGYVLVDYNQQQLGADGTLAHDFTNLLRKNLVTLGLDPAVLATQGKSGAWEGVNPDSGKDGLISYAATDGAYGFTGLGWSVMLSVDPKDAFAVLEETKGGMWIVQGVALILSLFIAFAVGNAVARPIKRSASVIAAIAEGDTSVEILGADRKDEIGELARASLVFKESVEERARLEAEQKEAEKRAVIEKKKAQADLASRFENRVQGIIQTVAAAATELYQTSESMGTIIGNVNNKAENVSKASGLASHNVQSVAAAAEEMSSTVKEIAHQIARSSQAVKEAVGQAEKADKTSDQLEEATKKIGEIVSLIQSIAGQINLLALNATIESARAGEAGKGFAVVAGEVKVLAAQTSKATDQIASYIASIQSVSHEVVTTLRSIRESIGHVNEYSSAMSAAVEEQSAATSEIAGNMGNAASSTAQISTDMTDVSRSSADASAASSQVLDAAKMLSQEAEKLDKEVKNFLSEVRAG